MTDLYYIQNSLSCVGNEALWWCIQGAGYTTHLSKAGRYSKDEASSIHRNRATDIPYPCAEVDVLAYRTVDVNDLRRRLCSSICQRSDQGQES